MNIKSLDLTFLKFLAVGVVNTLVGTTIMFVFYNWLQFNYWVSSAANYVIGSIVSYFLNKYFTFNYKETSKNNILKFAVHISVCYFIAYGIAKPVTAAVLSGMPLNVQENGALIVGMVLFVILNYIGQRCFVFKKQNEV